LRDGDLHGLSPSALRLLGPAVLPSLVVGKLRHETVQGLADVGE
jgi:hypothetical protein